MNSLQKNLLKCKEIKILIIPRFEAKVCTYAMQSNLHVWIEVIQKLKLHFEW